jgi:hypothetical protein
MFRLICSILFDENPFHWEIAIKEDDLVPIMSHHSLLNFLGLTHLLRHVSNPSKDVLVITRNSMLPHPEVPASLNESFISAQAKGTLGR